MKVHLKDERYGSAVCGAYKEGLPYALGPEAVTCQTCRKSVKWTFYAMGWKVRDKQA